MKAIPWEARRIEFTDAYVAGFLDGDGSIIATFERRPNRRRFPYRIRLKVSFTQHERHESFMRALMTHLGMGALRRIKSHRLLDIVVQDRTHVQKLLRRMQPYLVLKWRQAQIVLDVIDIYDHSKVNVRSSLSEKEFAAILSRVKQVRALNARTGGKQSESPVTTQTQVFKGLELQNAHESISS